jgi:hypothetical protein
MWKKKRRGRKTEDDGLGLGLGSGESDRTTDQRKSWLWGGKEREGNELGWPWEISEARTGQDGPGTLGRAPWALPSRVAGTRKIAYCRVEGAGTGD